MDTFALLASLLRSPVILRDYLEVLTPEIWTERNDRILVQEILDYYRQYRANPPRNDLLNLVVRKYQGSLREALVELINRAWAADLTRYGEDRLLVEIRKNAVASALRRSIDLLGKEDFNGIRQELMKAYAAESGPRGITPLAAESVSQFLNDPDAENSGRRGLIGTMFPILDFYLRGGVGTGELAVITLPPGHGKSQWLVNIGVAAMIQGRKVVHITLEMSENAVRYRYYQRIAGRTAYEILNDQSAANNLQEKIATMRALGAELEIKKFKAYKTPTDAIYFYCCRLPWKPNLVIVDYDELLEDPYSKKEQRDKVKDVYSGLIELGEDLGSSIWTGSQPNRQGYHGFIEMENLAEGAYKERNCHQAVAFCQTAEDLQASPPRGRAFILKNRYGPVRVSIPYQTDFERSAYYEINQQQPSLQSPIIMPAPLGMGFPR